MTQTEPKKRKYCENIATDTVLRIYMWPYATFLFRGSKEIPGGAKLPYEKKKIGSFINISFFLAAGFQTDFRNLRANCSAFTLISKIS